MALISRVSRLLRADLHAVLDHLEEPDVLLRQAVREMEQALCADQARLERQRNEHEHLRRRIRELEQAVAAIDGELDLCFEAGEHDLARSLCRRKLEATQLLETVGRRREDTARELAALEARCREQQLTFESMRQKAELLAGESAGAGEEPPGAPVVSRDDVEVAFLREQRKRSGS
jgi:phage shock protein A